MKPSDIAQQNFERRLSKLRLVDHTPPSKGWLRAVRDALGMTTRHLGGRIGVVPSRITALENAEIHGTTTIKSLKEAADAMGCEFVYAIVPKEPIESILAARASAVAHESVARTNHSMSLENQGLSPEQLKDEINRVAKVYTSGNKRRLWDMRLTNLQPTNSVKGDQIFGEVQTKELASTLGLRKNDERLETLRMRLEILAVEFRHIIFTTPSDLPNAPFRKTLTQRGDWLETNVLNPLSRLMRALHKKERPMFSTWPNDVIPPLDPSFDLTIELLHELQEFSTYLRQQLGHQRRDDANHSQEIRAMLVDAIMVILDEVGIDVVRTRGVYDKQRKEYIGAYPEGVLYIFKEITGSKDRMDRLIRGMVATPL